jgi:D-aminopeptidase
VRVHVISDMEGVAGLVKWEQVVGGEKLYEEGRVLYTEEINAAVRGAKAAGATEIVVMDCHGANLRFNGKLVGETGINAALCGNWGVPVLLVTGDLAVCREGRELLGDGLTTVEVKEGLGRFSARMKTPARARELIEEGAKRALSDLSAVAPYDPGRPCEIEIDFTSPDRLQEYANRKGVEVTGPRTLVARGDDWWSAWSDFFF